MKDNSPGSKVNSGVPSPDPDNTPSRLGLAWRGLLLVGVVVCALQIAVFVNHLASPEITRGLMLEAVRRVSEGLPLYPPPSGAYVALVHTPLFPVLAAALSCLFGLTPATLRLTALMGTVGTGAVILLAIRRETGSHICGFLGVALFAGAYRAFDGYVDYANPDSWMVFTAALGLLAIQTARGRAWNGLGVAFLCVSFWFKQTGAMLALGGVLYLGLREGFVRSLPYWAVAGLLGPVAYFVVGRWLGPHFTYFTYEVPRAWSTVDVHTFTRFARHTLRHWGILAGVAAFALYWATRQRRIASVWVFTLPFALAVGLLGAMDPGSEDNQFLVPGVWFILVGVVALDRLGRLLPRLSGRAVPAALAGSFALNAYHPVSVWVPASAWQDYSALVDRVSCLNGVVYLPDQGRLPDGPRPRVIAPWVQLEDLVRGPGRRTENHPLVKEILRDVVSPSGDGFIITDTPLASRGLLGFLAEDYVLVEDWGSRFMSLRAVPGRFSPRYWPRYLHARRTGRDTRPLATGSCVISQ